MEAMILKGQDAELSIKIVGHKNLHVPNSSDANWLDSNIEVRSGAFKGSVAANLTTQDFLVFRSSLSACLEGRQKSASFITDEDWLSFDLSISSVGRVTVVGKLRSFGIPSAMLKFSFETELGAIDRLLVSVSRISSQFPEK